MNKTHIGWTDYTGNPVSGCTKITEGCDHCMAHDLPENKRGTKAFPNGFEITYRPHKLDEPRRKRGASLSFVNSMSNVFHEAIDDDYRDRIFASIKAAPQHRFQVLTKRPKLAVRYLRRRSLPENVWLGVTVESRQWRSRIEILRSIDARVRFLSCEPLLEGLGELDLTGMPWLIAGGESGSHLSNRQMIDARSLVDRERRGRAWWPRHDRAEWVIRLRDQSVAAGVVFYMKRWGGTLPTSGGRELDGYTWNELADHVPGAMPGDEQEVLRD